MTSSYTITCDGCDRGYTWTHRSGTISLGVDRKLLRDEGWHAIRRPYTYEASDGETRTITTVRDICPECWAAGKR